MSTACLFCQIVEGDLPAEKVVETQRVYAFNDISPQAPTHVLVIPKTHIESAHEVNQSHGDLLGEMFEVARSVAQDRGIAPDGDKGGYRLVFNVGPDAQNTVPHLHLHVIGGRQFEWPPG